MIKARLTFMDDKEGQKELEEVIKNIKNNYKILSKSNIYKGRNNSQYSNVYLDIQKKK
jgi:hypothetical protein